MVIDCIDYIGINENLPTDIKYFKEELATNILKKSLDGKDIHNIVSVSVDCDVNSMKIINTPIRVSNEGQRLSGKKLLVEVALHFRIKYTTNIKQQYIYILKSTVNRVLYIVVPQEINDKKIEDLFRQRKLYITPYIEDVYSRIIDSNSVYIRTLLLLNLTSTKSYIKEF